MAAYSRYKKQPAEKIYLGFDITNDRPTGSSELVDIALSTVTVKVAATGVDVSDTLIEAGSMQRDSSGVILQARVISGTVEVGVYWIEFRAETTDGNKYEHDTKLTIIDPALATS